MSAPTRLVRFYDCEGRETGPPVYAVGREVDGRLEEYYTNAARARDDARAMRAQLEELERRWTNQ